MTAKRVIVPEEKKSKVSHPKITTELYMSKSMTKDGRKKTSQTTLLLKPSKNSLSVKQLPACRSTHLYCNRVSCCVAPTPEFRAIRVAHALLNK